MDEVLGVFPVLRGMAILTQDHEYKAVAAETRFDSVRGVAGSRRVASPQ